jgi:RNA polymerase sigma factor (TIGR02999 family)
LAELSENEPITILLRDFAAGNKAALDHLTALLYPELRRLARVYMRNERTAHTLQPTALVHEAYARLVKQDQPDYSSRAHFMGVAAHIMRQILIDHARARNAEKRGGKVAKVPLDEVTDLAAERPPAMIAIDDALRELERNDPLKAQLIEMRFFGGMTAEDSAEVLKITAAQVRRKLRVGQAWLQRALDGTAALERKT